MREATAWCDAQGIADVPPAWELGLAWGLAAATAVVLRLAATRAGGARTAWEVAGLAVASVPAWRILVSIAPDVARTVCVQGDVAAVVGAYSPPDPFPSWFLSRVAAHAVLENLAYPALGAALVLQGRAPGWLRRPTVATMARSLRGLLPVGRGREGEWASLRTGLAWFPVLALGNLALLALAGTPLDAAGKGPLYANMTAYHAAFLALAAGIGEEVVYRGILQGAAAAALRRAAPGLGTWGIASLASLAVAIPFAYAHAGYGNVDLFVFALAFSLVASAATVLYGLWAAIALHALIDFFAFFVSVPSPDAGFWALAVALGLASLAAATVELKALVQRRSAGPNA